MPNECKLKITSTVSGPLLNDALGIYINGNKLDEVANIVFTARAGDCVRCNIEIIPTEVEIDTVAMVQAKKRPYVDFGGFAPQEPIELEDE